MTSENAIHQFLESTRINQDFEILQLFTVRITLQHYIQKSMTSRDPNNGLVWCSNGSQVSNCRVVHFSGHYLSTRLNCPLFVWLNGLINHVTNKRPKSLNTGSHLNSGHQYVLHLDESVILGVCHSDPHCMNLNYFLTGVIYSSDESCIF